MTGSGVDEFWRRAGDGARPASLRGYLPANASELVPPPTWSFGTGTAADALLKLVVSGARTAAASEAAAYGPDEPLPAVGALDIVVDAYERPRALVETTAVHVESFDRVDAQHAWLEGEGDLSLARWREAHVWFLRAGGQFAPDTDVVLERFRVLQNA